LPWEPRQRFISRTGMEAENPLPFSPCRQFRGESTVHFGNAPATAAAPADAPQPLHLPPNLAVSVELLQPNAPATAAAPADAPQPLHLPPNLAVSVELLQPIDTETAAAGDLIAGRLAKPIFDAEKRPLDRKSV